MERARLAIQQRARLAAIGAKSRFGHGTQTQNTARECDGSPGVDTLAVQG
jgi:hypothetical protein